MENNLVSSVNGSLTGNPPSRSSQRSSELNKTTRSQVTVTPRDSLTDEILDITVSGLPSLTEITLRATITGDVGEVFKSTARYVSSEAGKVCVTTDACLGGSYEGVEPMGLMWSMKPAKGQREGLRLSKRDVTKPYIVTLDVIQGKEGDEVKGDIIGRGTFRRHFMAPGVRRVPVRAGKVRGTLFVPPGTGPFPGVIDLFGTAGGLLEFKAALLASHGFVAFAVAYFDYDDLPKVVTDVDLKYFEEAAQWLFKHESVIPHGIGLMGVSKGSEVVLTLASYRPELIKAVVAISPAHAHVAIPLLIHGQPTAFVKFEPEFTTLSEEGAIQWCDTYPDNVTKEDMSVTHPAMIAVERIECPTMLVCGDDDKSWHSSRMGGLVARRMAKHGRGAQCTLLCYHGTGHLIEPPYSPHCAFSYHKAYRMCCSWGGDPREHTRAEKDSWEKILRFLNQNINTLKSHL